MKRFAAFAAVVTASLTLAGTAGAAPSNPVVQWNQELLTLLQVPGAQPATIHPTRTLAITQLAVYDAVNAITGGYQPYLPTAPVASPRRVSLPAAVGAAARTSLLALLPSQQPAIDAMYQSSVAALGSTPAVHAGVLVGERAAQAVLAARSNDGSALAAPPFTPGSGPGAYQPTPPAMLPPVFGQWPKVTPFALHAAHQFRPPAPPALTSAQYVDAFNQVASLGRSTSTTRSVDQTAIAKFWGAAPIWIVWNQIAQMAVSGFQSTPAQSARLFALLDTGLADSVIGLYDAKYTYSRWRPITAITALDTGNPAAPPDPTWMPLATTAPDPSYPGAHATVSETAAMTLAEFFGTDNFAFSLSNQALPGVMRSFGSFSQAADEASVSRIYAGQHFAYDEQAGQALGRQVGDYISDHLLLRPQTRPIGDSGRGARRLSDRRSGAATDPSCAGAP
ncbi:MAG: vanadium-dependent haloperoxidase [Solirubrobacteraceae bacterium]